MLWKILVLRKKVARVSDLPTAIELWPFLTLPLPGQPAKDVPQGGFASRSPASLPLRGPRGTFLKGQTFTLFWLKRDGHLSMSLSLRASEDFLPHMRESLEELCFLRQEGDLFKGGL